MTGQSKMIYNKYDNSYIYQITTPDNPELLYIGSTCNSLEWRLKKHFETLDKYIKTGLNYVGSCDILKYNTVSIKKIKKVFCNTKEDLLKYEQFYIDKYGLNNLCNVRNAKSSKEQHKQQIKNWAINNKEKIKKSSQDFEKSDKRKAYKKAYEQSEARKKYILDNKEKIKERQRLYYLKNKK